MDDAAETLDTGAGGDAIVAGEPAAGVELVLQPAVTPPVPWYARPGVQTAAAATAGLIAGGTAFMVGRRLGSRAARSLAGRGLGFAPDDLAGGGLAGVPVLRSGTYVVHIRIHTRP